MTEFRVNTIYRAIAGEGWWSGLPCTIVRLQGCNLRCSFCDTPQAQSLHEGRRILLPELVREINKIHVPGQMTLITGGEPCLQKVPELAKALVPYGPVHLETNGTQELLSPFFFTWITVSPKGAIESLDAEVLRNAHEIKWLVGCPRDLAKLRAFVMVCPYAGFKRVSVQPISQNPLATEMCYQACLKYGWRLSLQLHKYLGKE